MPKALIVFNTYYMNIQGHISLQSLNNSLSGTCSLEKSLLDRPFKLRNRIDFRTTISPNDGAN